MLNNKYEQEYIESFEERVRNTLSPVRLIVDIIREIKQAKTPEDYEPIIQYIQKGFVLEASEKSIDTIITLSMMVDDVATKMTDSDRKLFYSKLQDLKTS